MKIALTTALILLVVSLVVVMLTPIVEYRALVQDIAYGKTYILYSGLFTLPTLLFITTLSIILITLHKTALRYTVLVLVFLWPMVISLNLLLHGYVISNDQPRPEFALGSLIVSGKVTLEQASKMSSYFNWPSTWLLGGIFSNIVGLSPFEAPVYLMVIVYLLLGLALVITSRKVFSVHGLALISMIVYAILNPYKILHLCPQIYALTLFVLFIALLFKENLIAEDLILAFILSAAVITSHPLTSLIVAGIACSIMLLNLAKRGGRLGSIFGFSAAVLILLVLWNLNYEDLIKSIIEEIFEKAQVQALSPIAKIKIYDIDIFFKLMAFYRYLSLAILSACSLFTIIMLFKYGRFVRIKILTACGGILAGSILLNFIPGSFFHRLLYFACTFMSALVPITISTIKKKLRMKVFSILTLLLIPLLSHIAILELLTNSNPVGVLTSPYETFSAIFVAKHYDFRGCVGNPPGEIGGLPFYVYLLNPNITNKPCIRSLGARVSLILTKQLDHISTNVFTESVYMDDLSIVSPRERFLYYMATLINDFKPVDLYLDANRSLIYSNSVFRIYSADKP